MDIRNLNKAAKERVFILISSVRLVIPDYSSLVYFLSLHVFLVSLSHSFHPKLVGYWGDESDLVEKYLVPVVSIYHPSYLIKTYEIRIAQQVFLYLITLTQFLIASFSVSIVLFSFDFLRQLIPVFHNKKLLLFNYILYPLMIDILISELPCTIEGHLQNFPSIDCSASSQRTMNVTIANLGIVLLTLNVIISLYFSSSRNLTVSKYTLRRDFAPEMMFIVTCFTRLGMTELLHSQQKMLYLIISFVAIANSTWRMGGGLSISHFRTYKIYFFGYALSFWTLCCMSLNTMAGHIFSRSLILFGVGCVIILIAIYLRPHNLEYEKLAMTTPSFSSPRNFIKTIETLLLLYQDKDATNASIFYGIMEKHQEKCVDNSCMLDFGRITSIEGQVELKVMLRFLQEAYLELISKGFIEGLKHFPYSSEVRVSYAYFLYTFQKRETIALEVLQACEPLEKTLEEEYMILRLNETLSMNILDEDDKDEGEDAILIPKERKSKGGEFKTIMLQRTDLLKKYLMMTVKSISDIWGVLQTESPDLRKLYLSLEKCHDWFSKTKELWDRNEENFRKSSIALRNYGLFLVYIFDSEDQGKILLATSQKLNAEYMKRHYEFRNLKPGVNLAASNEPIAFLTEIKGHLIFSEMNQTCSLNFMHPKLKMLNSKFSNLIPQIIRKDYIEILTNSLASRTQKPLTMLLLQRDNNLQEFSLIVNVKKN